MPRMRTRRAPLSARLVSVLLLWCFAGLAPAQTVTEYGLPNPNSGPFNITAGPDGALWFVEGFANKIGRISTSGAISETLVPTPNGNPQCIVSGPSSDGALWFVEGDGNKIGRITTAGVVTNEYADFTGGWPQCLALGPDGALWVANQGPKGGGAATGNGWITRFTTAGAKTKFPILSQNAQPSFIAAGPDGAMWFTIPDANRIGRITMSGTVTEYTVPTPNSGPVTIVAGPDGAMWFTENASSKIGRITTSGAITEFPLAANSNPFWIEKGPDGALWFTQPGLAPGAGGWSGGGQNIGRMTTSGTVSSVAIPTANSLPAAIVSGPDGALWFTEGFGNKIAKLTLAAPPPPAPPPPDPKQTVAPPPATQTSYSFATGQLPTTGIDTTASGTLGSVNLKVTLDLSKFFPAGTLAGLGQFAAGYNVYVVALVPAGRLGLKASTFFMLPPAPKTWTQLVSPMAAYLQGLSRSANTTLVEINILQTIDMTQLLGTEFYVGYGTDENDMLSNSRYRGVYIAQ